MGWNNWLIEIEMIQLLWLGWLLSNSKVQFGNVVGIEWNAMDFGWNELTRQVGKVEKKKRKWKLETNKNAKKTVNGPSTFFFHFLFIFFPFSFHFLFIFQTIEPGNLLDHDGGAPCTSRPCKPEGFPANSGHPDDSRQREANQTRSNPLQGWQISLFSPPTAPPSSGGRVRDVIKIHRRYRISVKWTLLRILSTLNCINLIDSIRIQSVFGWLKLVNRVSDVITISKMSFLQQNQILKKELCWEYCQLHLNALS